MLHREGMIIGLRPGDDLDWVFDFSTWLDGDTIASYVLETDLTAHDDSNTTTAVTAWFDDSVDDTQYPTYCTITTAAGRIYTRSVVFHGGYPTGREVTGSCA